MLILQNFSKCLCLLYVFVILTGVNSVYLKHGLRILFMTFMFSFFEKQTFSCAVLVTDFNVIYFLL